MTLVIRPKRGGFLRAFRCGEFIRDFLLGNGPYGSPGIDPDVGAPQSDIFYHYKTALMRATALDRATRVEEKRARKERRPIEPGNIESLAEMYLARMPYKAQGCRYHSFIIYFSNLVRLGWVEPTGREEPSAFQEHYPPGPPRAGITVLQRQGARPATLPGQTPAAPSTAEGRSIILQV